MFDAVKRYLLAGRTIRRLERAVTQAESDLAVEMAMNEQLRKSLMVATNPCAAQDYAIQDVFDAATCVVQAPDGEFIAPAAYDWERLAHDMLRLGSDYPTRTDDDEHFDGQGGVSGSW